MQKLRHLVGLLCKAIATESRFGQLLEMGYTTTSLVWWVHCTHNFRTPDYIEMSVSFIGAYTFFGAGYFFVNQTAKDIFKH